MKTEEIKGLTMLELKKRLEEEVKLYEQRKMNHRVSPIENPSAITKSRREISRIKTEIHYRKINHK